MLGVIWPGESDNLIPECVKHYETLTNKLCNYLNSHVILSSRITNVCKIHIELFHRKYNELDKKIRILLVCKMLFDKAAPVHLTLI